MKKAAGGDRVTTERDDRGFRDISSLPTGNIPL